MNIEKPEEKARVLAQMVDNAPNTIIVHDCEGNLVYVNRRALEVHGYTEAEFMSKSLFDIVVPEDAESVVPRMKEISQNGEAEFDVGHVRKDGSVFPLHISARKLDWAGRTVLMGIGTDLTERRRAEEQKRRLEEQLQQAMRMEAVGRLAGGVAHDFNNLLTCIAGNVQLALLDMPSGERLAELLGEINRAAESAATLTRQLLAFSRKQLAEPRLLDLNEIVSSMQTMLARLIGENVELVTRLGVPLDSVKIDPCHFEQVLVNLAINARDAMPDGGKLIIETANVEMLDEETGPDGIRAAGRHVMLSVSDTGHGMSREVKEHLFEPFYTTKPRGHGTGLGLATIYGAVKQAGGRIEVFSEPGLGTTFRICLPSNEIAAEKLGKAGPALELPRGSETILLVEDEAGVCELARRLLSRLGYRVLHASDGPTACRMSKVFQNRIDLLMTDVVMPGMNGRELAERLEASRPEMKVLFTSGYTEDTIVHHGVIDAGLNFIAKPYSLHGLARKLRQVLDSGR